MNDGCPMLNSLADTYPDVLRPARLWPRSEILGQLNPVPQEPGVYAWYFAEMSPQVPTGDCLTHQGRTLLYIGISPKAPPQNGGHSSSQTLRSRIRYHLTGNAEGSTLRLTLGCLLADRLGIELRRVGSGRRMTFAAGEATLSAWLADNAFVSWMITPTPWVVEEELIRAVSLPLNLDQNQNHTFHSALSALRRDAKAKARALPVVSNR